MVWNNWGEGRRRREGREGGGRRRREGRGERKERGGEGELEGRACLYIYMVLTLLVDE